MSLLDLFKRPAKKEPEPEPEPGDESRQLVNTLTPREQETYHLLLKGYTLRYCAEQLGVKYPTVNTYATAIYKKLGVRSRSELIIRYRDVL